MPCDRDEFLADIEVCRGSAVTGGTEACPAVATAARGRGAECLHIPMFPNGPPYAYSVCRPGAGADVRELCEAAGYVVDPPAAERSPARSQPPPPRAGMSPGAIGAIGATGAVTAVGMVAAGLGATFKRRKPLALGRYNVDGEIQDGEYHSMKFTEWLSGGYPQGEAVSLTTLLRDGLPGSDVPTTWDFKSKAEHDQFKAARYNYEQYPKDEYTIDEERAQARRNELQVERERGQATQKYDTLN